MRALNLNAACVSMFLAPPPSVILATFRHRISSAEQRMRGLRAVKTANQRSQLHSIETSFDCQPKTKTPRTLSKTQSGPTYKQLVDLAGASAIWLRVRGSAIHHGFDANALAAWARRVASFEPGMDTRALTTDHVRMGAASCAPAERRHDQPRDADASHVPGNVSVPSSICPRGMQGGRPCGPRRETEAR
ncbi:hypothetical protein ABIA20_005839 [Sinorhizobium fredii]